MPGILRRTRVLALGTTCFSMSGLELLKRISYTIRKIKHYINFRFERENLVPNPLILKKPIFFSRSRSLSALILDMFLPLYKFSNNNPDQTAPKPNPKNNPANNNQC